MTQTQIDCLDWRLVFRAQAANGNARYPRRIVTLSPRFRHKNMPDEVSLLLPANHGPGALIEHALGNPAPFTDAILGLFLVNPFMNAAQQARLLNQTGICWIANLPSIAQQDEEFGMQLIDVGLDQTREFEALDRFRSDGFKIAAVVSDAPGGRAACAIEPDMMIVLPRITDFAAGFPSLRQRRSATSSIHKTVRKANWDGPLLFLGEKTEAEHETLWPEWADGLICRPVPIAPG